MIRAAGRRTRSRPPWSKKRRRLAIILGIVLTLVIPALVWRARLAGEVRDALTELEAQGVPLTLQQLNDRLPAIPDGENAATVYREAARVYEDIPPHQREQLPFAGNARINPRGPLEQEALEAMRALVARNDPALVLLREAAMLPAARYIDAYSPGADTPSHHGQALETLVRLLCCQAILHAEAGDPARAMAALGDALAASQSLAHDGFPASLARQWALDGHILRALERVLSTAAPAGETLAPFEAYFTPERRATRIRQVVETDLCLFIARLRERRRPGLFRSIIVSAGVGDLNLRARLRAGMLALEWADASYDRRAVLESRYDDLYRQWIRRPLLYVTVLRYEPVARWASFRAALDQAAVAQAGLAVYRFQAARGRFPEELDALVPEALDSVPRLASTGEPVHDRPVAGGLEVHNGVEGNQRAHFFVYRGMPGQSELN